MNYETPAGRAHLMNSLRVTIAHLEKHGGVPRHVLLDVLSSTAKELGCPPAPGAAAKEHGRHYHTTNIEFTPEQYCVGPNAKEVAEAMRAVRALGEFTDTFVKEFRIGPTLSAFASQLAQMLVEFKSHGKEGALIANGILDNLTQCVKSGRSHVTEFHVRNEH